MCVCVLTFRGTTRAKSSISQEKSISEALSYHYQCKCCVFVPYVKDRWKILSRVPYMNGKMYQAFVYKKPCA